MIRRLLLLPALALAAGCVSAQPPSPPPQIFLLMGQSNMSGRGDLAELPPDWHTPDPRIRVLSNDGVLRLALEPIDSADNQIDAVSADRAAGVGPALAFAKAVVEYRPESSILLVPCAKGGTLIAVWAPAEGRDTLYGSCLARAREAAEVGTIAGVLWYQGESDTDSYELASAWPGAFESLISVLRADTGKPDLPVLMVSIGDRPINGPYAARFIAWHELQAAQNALLAPGVMVVPAAALDRNDDELHLSTIGALELGQRLADAWLALTEFE